MKRYDHLIVGGGMAGYAAVKAIREIDTESSIGMLSEDADGPYDRTALSKHLWRGGSEEDIVFDVDELGMELIPHRAVALDVSNRVVSGKSGKEFGYRKLLLATGVEPRFLPFEIDSVHYLHSLRQYRRLRAEADEGRSFLVVGGGWLGAELAAAIAQAGCEVAMAFPEPAIGAKTFPADLAEHVTAQFRERGVEVLAGHRVRSLERVPGDRMVATLSGSRRVEADRVAVAIGSVPRIDLAWTAGLADTDGVPVDGYFRTHAPAVFAAGDVASYPDPVLGRRRVEQEDHAVQSGRHAGLAMAGEGTPYEHVPHFYSEFFDHRYEAVGTLSSDLLTLAEWEEPYVKGVIHYLDEASRVRGVLAWNDPGRMNEAREVLGFGSLLEPLVGEHPVVFERQSDEHVRHGELGLLAL